MHGPRDILQPLGVTRRVMPMLIGPRNGSRDRIDDHHVAVSVSFVSCLDDPPSRWAELDRYIAERQLAALSPGR